VVACQYGQKGTTCFIITEITLSDRNTLWSTIVPQLNLSRIIKFDPEKPDQISGLGKIAVDLNHGKTEPPKPRSHNGMFGGPVEFLFSERSEYMLDQHSYAVPVYDNNMMVILNNNGDTLSTFSMLEKLKNYTKELQRALIMVLSMNIMENYTSVLSLMIRFSR